LDAEPDEGVVFEIFPATGLDQASGEVVDSAVARIVDDDGFATPASPWVSDPRVIEGDGGTVSVAYDLSLSLSRSLPLDVDVEIPWSVVGDTASYGEDVGAASGTVSIPRGSTETVVQFGLRGDEASEGLNRSDHTSFDGLSGEARLAPAKTLGTIRVSMSGDVDCENDGSLLFEVSAPDGPALLSGNASKAEAVGWIQDDDRRGDPLPLFVSSPEIREADADDTAVFEFELSRLAEEDLTIGYQTLDGSALAGEDCAATSEALATREGRSAATVRVQILGDIEFEGAGTFTLRVLLGPSISGLTGASAVIQDDGSGVEPWEQRGTAGHDRIDGYQFRDRIDGRDGDDRLVGGTDADRLTGGAGDDTPKGNHGADVDVFGADDGTDTIRGFDDGADVIRITEGADDFGGLDVRDAGHDVTIAFADTEIVLRDESFADIGAEDFVFNRDARSPRREGPRDHRPGALRRLRRGRRARCGGSA
jgi:Ca2+-binding RTX toxin-like protein